MNDVIYTKKDDSEVIEYLDKTFKVVNGDVHSMIKLLQADFGYTDESTIQALSLIHI